MDKKENGNVKNIGQKKAFVDKRETIDQIKPGIEACTYQIKGHYSYHRKLIGDMGFKKGAIVIVIENDPEKDSLLVNVAGKDVTVSKEFAQKITVLRHHSLSEVGFKHEYAFLDFPWKTQPRWLVGRRAITYFAGIPHERLVKTEQVEQTLLSMEKRRERLRRSAEIKEEKARRKAERENAKAERAEKKAQLEAEKAKRAEEKAKLAEEKTKSDQN